MVAPDSGSSSGDVSGDKRGLPVAPRDQQRRLSMGQVETTSPGYDDRQRFNRARAMVDGRHALGSGQAVLGTKGSPACLAASPRENAASSGSMLIQTQDRASRRGRLPIRPTFS